MLPFPPPHLPADSGPPSEPSLHGQARLLRDALFRLNTRRFGAVAELIIKKLKALSGPQSVFHDLFDPRTKQRIEVKFSTVLAKWSEPMREDNLLQVLQAAMSEERVVSFSNWEASLFDCNVQQVKPAEFDTLYYGLFFHDCVLVFHCHSSEVERMPGWSDKQHKGNQGEGQFHLTNKNLAEHLTRHLHLKLSYQELAALLFTQGSAES